jgi:Protein of unknown function (DUF2865)
MPETLTLSFPKWLLVSAVFFGAMAPGTSAMAQMNPNEPASGQFAPGNPMCPRLEAQLASIDRGSSTGDPARDDQLRRYQDAASRQQGELDRVTAQAKRMGCDSSGFFSLFSGQSAQCGPVNNQIQQMRSNLDQINSSLAQLRSGGGGGGQDSQRRSVLLALAQNNCGPQYAAAAQQSGPGAFFNNLFGGGNSNNPNPTIAPGVPGDLGAQSGTYRTVCVRTCDGGYFPISFATVPQRFPDDEKTCKALCPAAEASLFTYRNPGEDINAAVSINGQPYTALPNAFHYRNEFNPSCACKAAGQTWSEALQGVDDKAAATQQGDIIVTEENAKKLSQAPKTTGKKGAAPPATQAAAPPPPDAPAATTAPGGDKQIRSVGPTFVPAR